MSNRSRRPRSARESRSPQPGASLQFSKVNLVLGTAGVVVLSVGYWLLANGSITLAPLLLVLGYVVLLPLALIL